MSIRACVKFATALVLLLWAPPAKAFDTWWHADATRRGMVANGFSSDARFVAQFANYMTDFFAVTNDQIREKTEVRGKHEVADALARLHTFADPSYEYMHFDAIFSTADLERNWQQLFDNTRQSLIDHAASTEVKEGFRDIVLLSIVGSSLHVVQDFYSHSNWVEHFDAKRVPRIPVWFEIPASERAKIDLQTGAYPVGSMPGKLDHDTLNKDSSSRKLNIRATEVANRASIDWIARLMAAAPEVPWQSLRSYKVPSNIVMPRFKQLDETFLTSSSIVAGHFDGETPAKFVFVSNGNVGEEKVAALAGITLTLSQYLTTMSPTAPNKPSPFWSAFTDYRITRGLANGLLKNGKAFIAP